jgi:hypothetical protein
MMLRQTAGAAIAFLGTMALWFVLIAYCVLTRQPNY